ncbi:MAG: hypothetical protein JWL71_3432 [Acidobacteria bacterium]|nr:hypothetical protein [Acidobacteriota bacterium]
MTPPVMAQTSPAPAAAQDGAAASDAAVQDDWLTRWTKRVDEARASQPHYVAPIVTTHVVLVEQYRYDLSRQRDANGTATANFGASRGLELIPTTRLEIGVSPPPYLTHQSTVPDGFGDTSFQIKYRVSSAPEGKGDYFVGVFFGGSLPTGAAPNGAGHPVFLPTLAVAKGFGPVDVQTTLAAGLPGSGTDALGRTIVSNTAVDLRIKGTLWPMIEVNATHWSGGTLDGEREVFVTPGIVAGSFPLAERLHVGIGAGVQIAVSQFRRDNYRWIASVRLPF